MVTANLLHPHDTTASGKAQTRSLSASVGKPILALRPVFQPTRSYQNRMAMSRQSSQEASRKGAKAQSAGDSLGVSASWRDSGNWPRLPDASNPMCDPSQLVLSRRLGEDEIDEKGLTHILLRLSKELPQTCRLY
jgi:hypothetical protein